MYSKAEIFNLALGALLLSRRITDTDTDPSNEAKVLNTHWKTALNSTLADMDLDSTSMTVTLELIAEDVHPHWSFIYKYPANCAFLRRIQSGVRRDTRKSHIPKRTGLYGTPAQKAVFTGMNPAVAEIIPNDFPLGALSAEAGLAIAYKLAMLSAPLATGKGAKGLIDSINEKYNVAKLEAQEQDRLENFNFAEPEEESEFVEERTS